MNSTKFLTLISILLFTTMFAVSADAAKVYTWKDSSGVTHYSDKPFPKVRTKTISIKAARPKSNNAESGANAGESNAVQPKANLFDAADTKRLGTECSKARKNLVTLASGKNIRRTNAEGEKVVLDESQVQAEVQKNQTFINSYCRGDNGRSSTSTVYGDDDTDEESDEE